MWHLLTKLGTFWIADAKDDAQDNVDKFVLGLDDETLGVYKKADDALMDIQAHSTGHLDWDSQTRLKVPNNLTEWVPGEPKGW